VDVLVSSFSKTDGSLVWSRRFGNSTDFEYSTTCIINPDTGALYVGGNFQGGSIDFNPSAPGGELYNAGNSDGYVLKLDSSSGDYQNVWQIAGTGLDDYARVHDARGSKVFVTSRFEGTAHFPSGQTLTSRGLGDGYLLVIDETDAQSPAPPSTKFFVVDDGAQNRTYEYAGGGYGVENYSLHSGNTAPRGAAATASGDKVWVVDANKKVFVYSASGTLLGSWTAGSLPGSANAQGITVSGADVWIVDAKSDKVYKYTGAASRLSGSQNAASSFTLNISNRDPSDLVTDGASIWVLNNSSFDRVFKYTVSGTLLGSWEIMFAGGSPTGITLDPTGALADLWIVDNATDFVYELPGARNLTSGSQTASHGYALAPGNTNPQGIADPPTFYSDGAAESSSGASPAATGDPSFDAALLALVTELDEWMSGLPKRR
jgi:hypothetical protein